MSVRPLVFFAKSPEEAAKVLERKGLKDKAVLSGLSKKRFYAHTVGEGGFLLASKREVGGVWVVFAWSARTLSASGTYVVRTSEGFEAFGVLYKFVPQLREKLLDLSTRFLAVKGLRVPRRVLVLHYDPDLNAAFALPEGADDEVWVVTEYGIVPENPVFFPATVKNYVQMELTVLRGYKEEVDKEDLKEVVLHRIAQKLLGG